MGELGDKVRQFALEVSGELSTMEERPAARRAIDATPPLASTAQ